MLNFLEREFRKSGNDGLAGTIGQIHDILGKDIAFPDSGQFLNLELAKREYKDQPFNPELLTEFMRAFWAKAGYKIGKNIVVDKFPLSAEKIKEEWEERDRMAIFVPYDVNKEDLKKMFPEIGNWELAFGSPPIDLLNSSDWLWIEASVDAPRYTASGEFDENIKTGRSRGQSLKTYIIGGQISKLLTGMYFDEGGPTWSKLLGCFSAKGCAVRCHFEKDGSLAVSDRFFLEDGIRSEEKIKF